LRPGAGEERGQARQRRVDQHGDAALGNRADLADGHGDHVGGKGDRLGMEIAARERFVGLREDQRIVRNAIGLDQGGGGLAQKSSAAPITCGWQRRQ
jgi:hypothetical protein